MMGMVVPWLFLLLITRLDAHFRDTELSVLKEAVIDETAHIATAAIALVGFVSRVGISMALGALIGSTAIDADHLPAMAGSLILTEGTNRPYTHSLLSVLLAVSLGLVLPLSLQRFMWGVAVGLMSHLLRDMATGGVPLFWPLALASVTVPYSLYLAALGCCAFCASMREAAVIARGFSGSHRRSN
jgi:membrane-bound metal-dependent hydrolase YbcI (DUF457 family)